MKNAKSKNVPVRRCLVTLSFVLVALLLPAGGARAQTQEVIWQLPSAGTAVTFSPDGETVLGGNQIRAAANGKLIRTLNLRQGTGSSVNAVAFSPDGQYCAIGVQASNQNLNFFRVSDSPDGSTQQWNYDSPVFPRRTVCRHRRSGRHRQALACSRFHAGEYVPRRPGLWSPDFCRPLFRGWAISRGRGSGRPDHPSNLDRENRATAGRRLGDGRVALAHGRRIHSRRRLFYEPGWNCLQC